MENIQEIWYEPHPVSAERKAELRAQGYRIVDAIFAPKGHEQEASAQVAQAVAAASGDTPDGEDKKALQASTQNNNEAQSAEPVQVKKRGRPAK